MSADLAPDGLEAPGLRRVPWPRFDVVEVQRLGDGRVRWVVMDYQSKQTRFPLDPFSKTQAYELCMELQRKAQAAGEPTTVLRWSDAVSKPKPQKAAQERPKGNKRREHA